MRTFLMSAVVSLLFSFTLVLGYTYYFNKDKMGYIKTGIVLQKCKALQEATKQFNSELAVVQGNIDTLKNRFESLRGQERAIPVSQKAEWGYKVGIAEREYLQYSETSRKQLEQRQQQLTSEVLSQINSLIEEYGKKNNYRIILGTTNDGSILYGKEQDDLTEKIIDKLNKSYNKPDMLTSK